MHTAIAVTRLRTAIAYLEISYLGRLGLVGLRGTHVVLITPMVSTLI
jgi:hypothetical protein